MATSVAPIRPFAFEEAIALLVSRGIDERVVRLGTIQESALAFARAVVAQHCPRRALRALHVGNFVGVSLAAFSDVLIRHNRASVVLSIDPNLHHLGVQDPQNHVLALLEHFGLQRNNVVICGYSLHRVDNETKLGTFVARPASEHTLESLERLGQRIDVALIDGNHDVNYLRGEIAVLVRLLTDGGLLMLDDVLDAHPQIRDLFEEISGGSHELERVAYDGRLGVLRKIPAHTKHAT